MILVNVEVDRMKDGWFRLHVECDCALISVKTISSKVELVKMWTVIILRK